MKSEIIFYARVSTRRQGKSGLGLSAQRKAVQVFADAEAFQIVSEYVEVETGKGADALDRRPQLKAALVEAKRRKCSIVVAKLDRLSRDVEFISGLMSRRVPFIVAALGRNLRPLSPQQRRKSRHSGTAALGRCGSVLPGCRLSKRYPSINSLAVHCCTSHACRDAHYTIFGSPVCRHCMSPRARVALTIESGAGIS
jgi:hypothetical protein